MHQVRYNKYDVIVKVFDGFSCHSIGSIALPIEVMSKYLNVVFSTIPTSDQFRVNLGHPWLSSMKAITSTFHKCLKFPHGRKIIIVNHSMYQPTMRHGDVCLDYFWSKQFQPLQPRSDVLFKSYQKWKNEMVLSLSKIRNPTLSLLPTNDHMPLLKDRDILFPKEESIPSLKDEAIVPPMDRKTLPPKVNLFLLLGISI